MSTRAALRRAGVAIEPPMTPFVRVTRIVPADLPPGAAALSADASLYRNNLYQVAVREDPSGLTHLSIHRLDRSPTHDWRHLQRIKNALCGTRREGLELYPSEDRLIDMANETHLWVLPTGSPIPVGWNEGRLVSEAELYGARQRPFSTKPADLLSAAALEAKLAALGTTQTEEGAD